MNLKDKNFGLNEMGPLLKDEKFHHFLDCGNIAIMYLDRTGALGYITPSISSITGLSVKDYGKSILDTGFSKQYPKQMQHIMAFAAHAAGLDRPEAMGKKKSYKHRTEIELEGLNRLSYQIVARPCTSFDNQEDGTILVFYDITKRKTVEAALEVEKEKYRLIAELMDSALWEYDIRKKTLRQYRKLKGRYSEKGLVIRDFRNTIIKNGWVHPEDLPVFEAYCDSMDRGEDNFNYDLRGLGDNGEYIWLRYQGAALKASDGNARIIMGRTLNIDREYKDHEKLIRKTERDALTGLYNRAAAKEKAEQCFERCNRDYKNEIHSFMIVDIDNFKQANDQWGHLYGDILLEAFAKQLEDLFDSTDIVGRIGGDEFVVLQKDILQPEQIEKSAKAICDIARRGMNEPRDYEELTVSVGIAVYPADGRNYDTLYRKADIALYEAKSAGKDQYARYLPETEQLRQKAEVTGNSFISAETVLKDAPDIEKRLLNFAFDIVNEAMDLDSAIRHILHEIGKYYDLSRIIVFELCNRNSEIRSSYEWLNTGIAPFRFLPYYSLDANAQEYLELFSENGIFYFNDVAAAEINPSIRQFYKAAGTKALIQCAIFDGSKFIGSISYEDQTAARKWSKTERDTLFTLTKMIGSYLIQLKNKRELDYEVFFTQATLDNQNLSNYAVKEGTYELLYFSKYTKNLFPGIKLGALCHKAIYNLDYPCDICPLKGLDGAHRSYSVDTYDSEKDTWYSSTASVATLPNGENINLICSSDVTGFIERMTSKDSMTGLLTLSKFEIDATKLMNSPASSKYLIIYSDFDKFKNINDEWGYSTGNEVLIKYADIISRYLKPGELFCRITSDIFVMMVSYQNKKSALQRIDHSYHQIEAEFKKVFPKLNPVITSGIYFLQPEDKNIVAAIDRANLARKTIKGLHKSSFTLYDKALHEQVTKEKIIAGNMYDALKNEEFQVYMQPKIELSTLRIIGAEALVRWRLSSGELLNPMEFIPIFEKNGFIHELDFYVYEKTLQALRKWLDMGKRELVISVNVSRIHLQEASFHNRLCNLLEKYQIPSRLIELEITESMFYGELERLEHIIRGLRKQGFLISIDDFGSGYSSLNMLKQLPVDILKLDREFFMNNKMGEPDKIVISGIISLAKGLGLKVISEGVETLEQLAFLRENRCDMAQGYLFHKPMPMEEFIELIED